MTKYLVLRKVKQPANSASSGPKGWDEIGRVDAQSADAAIRDIAERSGFDGDAQYVAVPSRSWKPRSVTVEKTTAVKLA